MRVVSRAIAWELGLATVFWLLAPAPREVWDLVRAPQAYVDASGANAAAVVLASALLCALCGVLAVAVAAAAVGELHQSAAGVRSAVRPVMQLAALMVGAAVLPAACAPVGAPASTSTSSPADPTQDAAPTVIDQFDWPAAGAEQAPPATTAQPPLPPPTPPSEAPPAPKASPGAADDTGATYTVVSGDCLWSIATALLGPGVSLAEIADAVDDLWIANSAAIGTDPDLLLPGQVLQLPFPPPTHT